MKDLGKAQIRLVPPAHGGTVRAFDVEVTTDGGETWERLATYSVSFVQGRANEPARVNIEVPLPSPVASVAWNSVPLPPIPGHVR